MGNQWRFESSRPHQAFAPRPRRFAAGLAALGAAIAVSGDAAAQATGCPASRIPFTFCDGCSYDREMIVPKNTPCASNWRIDGPISLDSFRITRPAKHGVAGVRTGSYAYSPAKDFVGRDDFAYEIRFRDRSNRPGTMQFNVSVTVR